MSQTFVSANSLSYPADGTKKTGAQGGTYTVDFEQGTITGPDSKTDNLSTSLRKIGSQFVKSIYVWVSAVDAIIKVGNTTLPKMQQPSYIVSGIGFDHMSITFPNNRTPENDFAFQILATDAEIFPYDVSTLIASYSPPSLVGNSGAAYAVIKDLLAVGYSSLVFQVFNTDGANALNCKVESSEDGINWALEPNYPETIAAGATNIFGDQVKHAYYRVSVETNVVGQTPGYVVATFLMR